MYSTYDYTRFKSITGNRLLNESKIKRIIADINKGLNMLPYCPIVVDKQMNVIDGQHRLYVARKLKKQISYVIADALTLQQIASINSNTEKWKKKDFMHCYTVGGNQNYEQLQRFMHEYNVPLSTALVLLSGKTTDSGACNKDYESGNFVVKDLSGATATMKIVERFKEAKNYHQRSFILAIARLREAGICDFNRLVEKFSKNPSALRTAGNVKEYLRNLQDIYNTGLQKQITIF